MDERLYNPEIKERFLEERYGSNEQTQTTMRYILYKAKPIEEALNKDLFDFSTQEVKSVLKNTDPLNLNVAKNNGVFLSQYLNFAIEKGYRSTNIHPLNGISDEWYKDTVGDKKLYITDNELLQLEDGLVNYQDKVVLRLIFEGCFGHGLSELLNLRDSKEDINFETNELHLKETKNDVVIKERTIKVSDECIRLIKGAITEKEYLNKNGQAKAGNKVMELIENDYVIRNINRTTSNQDNPADKHVLYRRITTVSEIFDLPYLTAKSLQKSGMLRLARDLYLRNRKLEKDELYQIGDHFGLSKIKSGDYEYHNTTAIAQVVNRENILELYGIDIAK